MTEQGISFISLSLYISQSIRKVKAGYFLSIYRTNSLRNAKDTTVSLTQYSSQIMSRLYTEFKSV